MPIAAPAASGNNYLPLILIAAMIVGMYFLLIRPQQKRRREAMEQQRNVGVGDQIVTIGGLYGTIVALDEETMTLQIAPGVTVKYARGAFAKQIKAQDGSDEAIADETSTDTK